MQPHLESHTAKQPSERAHLPREEDIQRQAQYPHAEIFVSAGRCRLLRREEVYHQGHTQQGCKRTAYWRWRYFTEEDKTPSPRWWLETSSLIPRAHSSAAYRSRGLLRCTTREVFDEFEAEGYAERQIRKSLELAGSICLEL